MKFKDLAPIHPLPNEPPITLGDVSSEMVDDSETEDKKVKYRFDEEKFKIIETKVKDSVSNDPENNKCILESLKKLKESAEKLSKTKQGIFSIENQPSLPPHPTPINNFIQINKSLIDISSKLCTFQLNYDFQKTLDAKHPNTEEIKDSKNDQEIIPLETFPTVAPRPKKSGRKRRYSRDSIKSNPKSSKSANKYSKMFNSEIDKKEFIKIKLRKPTELVSSTISYIKPTKINLSKIKKAK